MKNAIIVISALMATTAATSAQAEDRPWSGPYVGFYTGANAGSNEFGDYWCWSACGAPVINVIKPAIGATVGINFQPDENLVVGVEADIGSGFKDEKTYPTFATPIYRWATNIKWQSTVRARAGLTSGKTLAYVTGGYAFANADFSETTDKTARGGGAANVAWGANWKGTTSGYVYGAGIEHKFGSVSTKFEFLRESFGTHNACYKDLEGANAGVCWPTGIYSNPKSVSFSPTVSSLKVGLNFQF